MKKEKKELELKTSEFVEPDDILIIPESFF